MALTNKNVVLPPALADAINKILLDPATRRLDSRLAIGTTEKKFRKLMNVECDEEEYALLLEAVPDVTVASLDKTPAMVISEFGTAEVQTWTTIDLVKAEVAFCKIDQLDKLPPCAVCWKKISVPDPHRHQRWWIPHHLTKHGRIDVAAVAVLGGQSGHHAGPADGDQPALSRTGSEAGVGGAADSHESHGRLPGRVSQDACRGLRVGRGGSGRPRRG
jgi:hypothetical protein